MENKIRPTPFENSGQSQLPQEVGLDRHNEAVVFDALSGKENREESQTMDFREWRDNGFQAEIGTTVVDVPPRFLFTTQDWLREDKMVRAVEAQEGGAPDAFTVPGVIFKHPKEKMGTVPVLREGNHRVVNALLNGNRINFKVVNAKLDPNAQVWRVTNLVTRYGGLMTR